MFCKNSNSCHNETLILVIKNQRSLRSFYRLFLFFGLLINRVGTEFNFKLCIPSMKISASLSLNSRLSIDFLPKSDFFVLSLKTKRISAFKNGRNQKRQSIRINNLFHFFQLSKIFLYFVAVCTSSKTFASFLWFSKIWKIYDCFDDCAKNLEKSFLSDPAGCRAEGRKPGVCPAKIGKWTAY